MKLVDSFSFDQHSPWQDYELNISTLLGSPFDFVVLLDSQGHILNAGEKSGERFQMDYEELVGKCIWDLLPPEVISKRRSYLAQVFLTGRAVRFQDERRGQWHDIMIIPIFSQNGKTIKAVILAYDITSQIIAEDKIQLLARFPEENPSPVLRVNRKGSIVYANKASGALLNNWGAGIGRQLPDKIKRVLTLASRSGKIREIIETYDNRTLSLFITPLNGSEFLNIYGHDITDRIRAAKALQESEERFRNLVETSHDLIWRCDNNGCFTYLNPAWENTLGYTPDEMLGHHFWEFKPGGFTHKDKQLLKQVLAGAEIFGIETIYISKTGHHVNLVFNVRRLLDIDENTIGTQGSAHNITERKQAEIKLQQSEAHYRNLFMNNPAAILEANFSGIGNWLDKLRSSGVKDLNEYLLKNPELFQQAEILIHIIDINLSAQRLLEIEKENYTTSVVANIFSKNSFEMLRGLLLAIWDGHNHFEKEGSGCSAKGNQIDFIMQWSSPLNGERPDLSRGVLALTDITQTKILKTRLVQNEKMVTLGHLVSGISHEINNPNNFIMFNLPILRNYLKELLPIIDTYSATDNNFELFGMSYPEFRKDLMALLDNMEHGSNRINETVSRLRGFFSPCDREQLSWIDIESVVGKSVAICQSQIKKMVKKVELIIPQNLPQYYTDPSALEHIIINLLINAAYAADKQKSWIKIKVLQDKSWRNRLTIEVQDNGCGMDKNCQEKIFEPFYTTKSANGNSGLGMFIAYNLIEGLGGEIVLKSKPGVGTTFRIMLPEMNPQVS